jgi:hypothetical protein
MAQSGTRITRHLAAGLALVLPLGGWAAVPVHHPEVAVGGQVLVKYRDGADAAALTAKRSLNFATLRTLLRGRLELLEIPAFMDTEQALATLRADPRVAYAEPNFRRFRRTHCASPPCVPNDPLFTDQWGLHSTGQPNFAAPGDPSLASIPGADMDMLRAWDPDGDGHFDRVGDGAVTIAIIDDSVTTTHPDLAANMLPGFDFSGNDADPDPDPGSGEEHGTLVAGAAGAIGNNGIGVAGAAWNVRLLPLKFGFLESEFIAALDYARDQGAKIVNASFGGPGYSQAEVDALQDVADSGVLFVAAAGNDDSNTDVAELNYPANYDVDNIVSVAATNRQDNIASFSQYGPVTTDVAAPGLQIVTTSNTGYAGPPGVAGTSFSAPYTAGVAALVMAHVDADALMPARQVPGYREVKARLIEGAEPAANASQRTSGGRVNAANSLELAPRAALVIRDVVWPEGNGVLDAGETTPVQITLTNLWRDAVNVAATLSADNGVTVAGGAVDYGAIAAQGSVTRSFAVTIPPGITDHRYVTFTLAITAGDGYAATRKFIAEIGDLGADLVTQSFAPRDVDLYDEFHAWHFDLASVPAGHNQLVIETTSTPDIDLLAKRGQPPVYNITVGINPETDVGFFCTSGHTSNCQDPDTEISGALDGNERVTFDNPVPGTYHIVVVNFAQLDEGLTYGLRAYTQKSGTVAPPAGGGFGGGGGGGGLLAPGALLVLLLGHAWRARRRA